MDFTKSIVIIHYMDHGSPNWELFDEQVKRISSKITGSAQTVQDEWDQILFCAIWDVWHRPIDNFVPYSAIVSQ